MIDNILQHSELIKKPPILFDIGASGNIHKDWKKIAKYSIAIGFDADVRETDFVESESKGYKKLYIFNSIVAEKNGVTDFYLTKSPYCSSRLEPNTGELQNWTFNNLFTIEKKISENCITLSSVLEKLNINYIDWFKTDSQGTDLRIFKSLSDNLINKIIAAEFEPGIINAYNKEDFLFSIIDFMNNKNFWMSEMHVKGSQRMTQASFNKHFSKYNNNFNKIFKFKHQLVTSPCWAEICYLNDFKNKDLINKRDLLLAIAIAFIKKQYGYAIDLSELGIEYFGENIFNESLNYSIRKIKNKKKYLLFKRLYYKIYRTINNYT